MRGNVCAPKLFLNLFVPFRNLPHRCRVVVNVFANLIARAQNRGPSPIDPRPLNVHSSWTKKWKGAKVGGWPEMRNTMRKKERGFEGEKEATKWPLKNARKNGQLNILVGGCCKSWNSFIWPIRDEFRLPPHFLIIGRTK